MNVDKLIVDQIYKSYVLLGSPKGTLVREVQGEIDPGEGEPVSTTTLIFHPLYKTDATSLKTLGFRFGDDLVKAGDVQISIPAKGITFAPDAGDRFVGRDGSRSVVDVRPSYAPGGTPTEYTLLVRR